MGVLKGLRSPAIRKILPRLSDSSIIVVVACAALVVDFFFSS